MSTPQRTKKPAKPFFIRLCGRFMKENGGANQDRTDDLFNAIEALYQLSYDPKEECRK